MKNGLLIQMVLILSLLLLPLSSNSNAAISVLDSADVCVGGAGSCSATISVNASADVLWILNMVDDNTDMTSCTWNGSAVTVANADSYADQGYAGSGIFSWTSPDTGSHTASCGHSSYLSYKVVKYLSVSGAGAFEDEGTDTGNQSGASVTLSPHASGSIAISYFAADRVVTPVAGAGQTEFGTSSTVQMSCYGIDDATQSYSSGSAGAIALSATGWTVSGAEEPPAAETRAQVTSGVIWF